MSMREAFKLTVRKDSLITRLFALILVSLIGASAIQAGLFYLGLNGIGERLAASETELLMRRESAQLNNLLSAPLGVLASYQAEAENPRIISEQIDAVMSIVLSKAYGPEERRKALFETVSAVRYGPYGRDFLWITDTKKILLHPRGIFSDNAAVDNPAFIGQGETESVLTRLIARCLAKDKDTGQPVGAASAIYLPAGKDVDYGHMLVYMRYLPELQVFVCGEMRIADNLKPLKDKALAEIANMRLADGNYFWVNDLEGNILIHPDRPDLVGTNILETRDVNGKLFAKELIEQCRAQGHGSTSYVWSKPGQTGDDHPKISSARVFKPWNVVVAMGVYLDDINAQADAHRRSLLESARSMLLHNTSYILLVAALIGVVVVAFLNRVLAAPLTRLTDYASGVADGALDLPRQTGSFPCELGILKSSMEKLVDNVKTTLEEADRQRSVAAHQAGRAKEALRDSAGARRDANHLARYQDQEFAKLSLALTDLADGDLTVAYTPEHVDDPACRDAMIRFTDMGRTLSSVTASLSAILSDITSHSATLALASQRLASFSVQMLGSTEEMNTQAASVSSVTSQLSGNLSGIAASIDQLSNGVRAVSSTAEEISSAMNSVADSVENFSRSIGQIADSAHKGSAITSEAMSMAVRAGEVMNSLGLAAREIGVVTDVIKRIADQTNLLALNATIEAASAGEAGRGFAVVAGEVKLLAGKSAKAATDISERIGGVQKRTNEAVGLITDIVEVMRRVDASATSISGEVERQTDSVDEIAGSVSQTETGIEEIARAISEAARNAEEISQHAADSARGVRDVATNIKGVSQALAGNSRAAQEVRDMAGGLADTASALRVAVGRFRTR